MIHNCCDTKNSEEMKKLAGFLRIIAEENRLRIICMLRRGEKCVCELWQSLKLPQNLVSHHLKVLKKLDLIGSRKDGLKVIYSLKEDEIEQYLKKIIYLLKK
jgi:ArsR family transcriptional regulator